MKIEPVPRSTNYDYRGRCWWCGNEANSREHKSKKSELNAIYGPADSEAYPLTWIDDDGNTKIIQGPDSTIVKFEKSLCQNCNNSRSQPFDRAYDHWLRHITSNYDQIIKSRLVNLRDIVDHADYEEFKLNLSKYFAKHIGCRVADGGAGKAPDSLIAFINGETKESDFAWAELCLSRSALEQYDVARQRLGMSRTVGSFLQDGTALTSLKGSLMHGALQLVWDINLDSSRPDGGNGILANDSQKLRAIGDDLYEHRFEVYGFNGILRRIVGLWHR